MENESSYWVVRYYHNDQIIGVFPNADFLTAVACAERSAGSKAPVSIANWAEEDEGKAFFYIEESGWSSPPEPAYF